MINIKSVLSALAKSILPGLVICLLSFCSCDKSIIDKNATFHAFAGIDSLNAVLHDQVTTSENNTKLADSLFTLSLSLGYNKGISESSVIIIHFSRIDYQYSKAIDFIAKNLQKIEDINDISLIAPVYFELGKLHKDLDNFDLAFDYLTKALTFYNKTDNKKSCSEIYSILGLLFRDLDISKSFYYQKLAIGISKEINDSIGIARELNNMALTFNKENRIDSAQLHFEQAMAINKKLKNWKYYSRNLGNMADLEKSRNNFQVSEALYNEMLEVIDVSSDIRFYANTMLHLGDLHLKMENYHKAIPYFRNAILLSEKYKLIEFLMYGNKGLYLCNKGLSNADSSLFFAEVYQNFKDSLAIKKNSEELMRLEANYDFEQLNKERESKQKFQTILLVGLLVFLLLITIILIQFIKKQKLANQANMLKVKLLQNELEVRNRELASYVLNMVRVNEKKLGIIAYLKKQQPEFKIQNQKIIDTVIRDLEMDQDSRMWEEFEIRFNKVNNDFYQKLSARFPDLTSNEKRLCAFLFMDMNTKEIASITGQSNEAIVKARTRLRRKLGISNQEESISTILTAI